MANLEEVQEYIERKIRVGNVFDSKGYINTDNAIIVGKKIFDNVAPGFFTPFQSGKDFGVNLGITAASLICAPLLLGTLSAVLAIGAAVAAVTFVGGLLFAVKALTFDTEMAGMSLMIGLGAGAISLACIAGILIAVAALITTPLQLLHFTTRSAASVPNLLCNAPANEEDKMILNFS
ncbi:MAG: hypothetical protein H0U57_12165 [Tatlockia sp.]|nr:hypothetical protein [Tatlockia sp.]